MTVARNRRAAAWIVLVLAALAIPGGAAALAQTATKPAHGAALEEGHRLFNSQCAHCHGEDAGADDPFYNLPQLLSDKDDKFFFATVGKGVPDKGMPPWKDVLKPRQITNLLIYLRSLEREQGLIDDQPSQ
jgi:polar amino acid transport system substrate-binding protein